MMIEPGHLFWLRAVTNAALFIASFTVFYCVFRAWPRRRRRWPVSVWKQWLRRRRYPPLVLGLFGIKETGESMERKERLLVKAGMALDPVLYELLRRSALAAAGCATAAGLWLLSGTRPVPPLVEPVYIVLSGVTALIVLLLDPVILEALGKYRSQRIMKEIYVLSNQLLYYTGSKMSLHAKLVRCVPFSRSIRGELQLLLNEWYEDAERAIGRFKRRLGTDEAYSFAETLNSIRLNESDSYYELLRERIQDYKEKLELARDSRKETTSYILFVIAGIPILNTFRLFVYPWVQEGQKLFDSIHS